MKNVIIVLGAILLILGLVLYAIFRVKNRGVTFNMQKLSPKLRRNAIIFGIIGIVFMLIGFFAPSSLYLSSKNDTIEAGNQAANKIKLNDGDNKEVPQSTQMSQTTGASGLANQAEFNEQQATKNAKRPYSQFIDARMQSALARQSLNVSGKVQQVATIQVAGQSGTAALVNMNNNLYVVVLPNGFNATVNMTVQAQTIMTGQLLTANSNSGITTPDNKPVQVPVVIATNMTEQKQATNIPTNGTKEKKHHKKITGMNNQVNMNNNQQTQQPVQNTNNNQNNGNH